MPLFLLLFLRDREEQWYAESKGRRNIQTEFMAYMTLLRVYFGDTPDHDLYLTGCPAAL
jgi:hypothetical protein